MDDRKSSHYLERQQHCRVLLLNQTPVPTHTTSWLGGKNFPTLTFTGGKADHRKYAEIRKWDIRKYESILQKNKLDEKDVNVDYSCSIGSSENGTKVVISTRQV